MRGGESYTFSQVPLADIPRSTFNRSHGHKTTFDSGYLVPVFIDEALPGDTFKVDGSFFARMSTPIFPVMDNLHMDVFFFAVPNRLLWDKWEKLMGAQDNPGDSIDFLVPQVSANAWAYASLADYFGLPVYSATYAVTCPPVSALFFRAYNLIWNDWFRDENLQNSVPENRGDGPDTPGNYVLLRRGKRHDYFTSCLPWPQKGTAVSIPLGSTAPVNLVAASAPTWTMASGVSPTASGIEITSNAGGKQAIRTAATMGAGGSVVSPATWANIGITATADLSTATAATINSLRQAFQIQKLMERDARGGTRYVEILKSHFGVVSPDFRLQRPEFLGGGSVPVTVNPVVQTSATGLTGGNTAKGSLAAFAVAGKSGIGFSKSFVEHSVIMGLVAVRADLSYQQGLPRMFSRRTRYDFYWPALAHIGEQAVLNQEIYCQTDGTAANTQTFGYQERWAEYRYFPSKITGKFRSTDATPLDAWHLAQKFAAPPTLGDTFIQDTPPVSRVVAVTTEPQFIFDSHWSIACTRPMPTYSVPGLIDHF